MGWGGVGWGGVKATTLLQLRKIAFRTVIVSIPRFAIVGLFALYILVSRILFPGFLSG